MSTVAAKEILTITRELDAPREIVWKAWTEPEHFMRWWGPRRYSAPYCRIDLKVGGTYLNCMRSPDGKDFWTTGVYKEIDAPYRLVYTDSFADEKGNVVQAAHYGLGEDFPLESLVTVTLEDLSGKRTRMTMVHAPLPAGRTYDETASGWNQSFDKMAAAFG
jgi:uncharacterized protein YndB with AHSA1/START domain